jgi:site-specific recombinase XerD
VTFLTETEIDALLAAPDRTTWTGRRDTALFSLAVRDALERRLVRYVEDATAQCPSMARKRVTMHVLRHSAAMRLLRAGIDSSGIALWLGNEQIETTQIYLHADLPIKELALEKTAPIATKPGRFRPTDKLLAFLEAL